MDIDKLKSDAIGQYNMHSHTLKEGLADDEHEAAHIKLWGTVLDAIRVFEGETQAVSS